MLAAIRPPRPDEYTTLGDIVVAAYADVGALHGEEACEAELRDIAARGATATVLVAADPAAAGRGAGTALTTACVDLARAQGRERVVLHTFPVMAGVQRIYERLGFLPAAERDREPIPGLALLCFVLELAGSSADDRPPVEAKTR